MREAYARAVHRLPAPLARELRGVTLTRQPDLSVPGQAPLIARLIGRGAQAYYSILERRVVVTDAGALGRATWTGGDASRAETAVFLASIAAALDAPPDDLDALWRAFAAAVGGGEHPIGDARVLDRFVAAAPGRALGGEVSLEQLIFHELMHGVQLEQDTMEERLRSWCGLVGWLDMQTRRVTDGSFDAVFQLERPEVLVQLVVGGARGAGEYVPDAEHGSTNVYTRYDPREDYADSARTMAFDPTTLAREAPEKFLYLNALGWTARLDDREPGPLWWGPRELGADSFRDTVGRGARAILGRAGAHDGVPPRAVAAVLSAHAEWIPPELVPRRAASRPPDDLPPSVAALGVPTFRVADGSARFVPARSVAGAWDAGLLDWMNVREIELALGELVSDEAWEPGPAAEGTLFAQVEAARLHFRALRAAGDPGAEDAARAIPGRTWGAVCRARALADLGLLEEARAAAQQAALPRLRGVLLGELAR